MKGSSYLRWFRRSAVLGAVVAGVTASSAAAVPMLDPQDTPAVSHTTALGVRADGLRWQGIAKAYQSIQQAPAPDVIERYVATHPSGQGAVAVGTERIVDDSFRNPTPVVTPAGDRIVDDSFRDPKPVATTNAAPAVDRIVDDSFRDAARYVPSTSTGNSGLDWGDFGIGAGAMLGLALLVTGLSVGTVAMRHRPGKLGTS
jgi:hypothetical protein